MTHYNGPITEEDVKSWYNPAKKGIIVVGNPRCGSHYLTSVICQVFASIGVQVTYVGEVSPRDNDYSKLMEGQVTGFDSIFSEFILQFGYSIASIVTDPMIISFFLSAKYNQTIQDNYTIIKVTRSRDKMRHYMSQLLHEVNNGKHEGMKRSEIISQITLPRTVSVFEVSLFLSRCNMLSTLPSTHTVDYDDFNFTTATPFVKNDYGITPREFFANYDELAKFIGDQIE